MVPRELGRRDRQAEKGGRSRGSRNAIGRSTTRAYRISQGHKLGTNLHRTGSQL
jgi:hypothetical protein